MKSRTTPLHDTKHGVTGRRLRTSRAGCTAIFSFACLVLLVALSKSSSIAVGRLRCDPHVSAIVDCLTLAPRQFQLPLCQRAFTIPDLFADFSAHQVEWSLLGKTKAFWSVITHLPEDDEQVTQEMMKDFYESGVTDIRKMVEDIARVYPKWNLQGDVLDFGCGLGRLGIALAQTEGISSVSCVDQSVFHLIKTHRFTERMRKRADFHVVVSGPDLLMALQNSQVPKCYDFVNSLIVLQHMITPLQAVYLEQLCDVLKPNGKMRIQIPSQSPLQPACDPKLREAYRDLGGLQMHHIDENSVGRILSARGCDVKIEDLGTEYVGAGHNSIMVYATKRPNYHTPCSS